MSDAYAAQLLELYAALGVRTHEEAKARIEAITRERDEARDLNRLYNEAMMDVWDALVRTEALACTDRQGTFPERIHAIRQRIEQQRAALQQAREVVRLALTRLAGAQQRTMAAKALKAINAALGEAA